MLKKFIPLPWFRRERFKPKIYRVNCPQCDYTETLQIESPDVVIHENPDCATANALRLVAELPHSCPRCGAPLKKEKIPVMLRY